MTPTSVGLVLVDGQDADGTLMDRDSFATDAVLEGSEQATAAVIAATRGLRLQSIGVTWSEDADAQATMLMQSLSDSGFDNVMAIRLPEATEALARGIADVLGHETTAVCVIEPDSVITLIVNTRDGAVQTAFNHAIDSDEALVSWLSTIFTRADWAPEALVVVGSAGGFDSIMPQLEDALSVPVFAPEEAKLALARGAALASAQNTDLPLHLLEDVTADGDWGRHRAAGPLGLRRRSSSLGPAAMLAAGVVTFVVSASIAISLQLSPSHEAPPNPAPAARAEPAAEPSPPAMPPPTASTAPVDEAAPSPAPEDPAPVYQESPVAITEAPSEPATDAPSDGAPAADPALGTDAPAEIAAPPYAAPPVPAVPTKRPGILSRIKERLTRGNDN